MYVFHFLNSVVGMDGKLEQPNLGQINCLMSDLRCVSFIMAWPDCAKGSPPPLSKLSKSKIFNISDTQSCLAVLFGDKPVIG